jgi:prepilin-type N-terminal cleavage/methylation domain-containing protein
MKRQGTTLIELIISIAILGIMAGVTSLAMHSLTPKVDQVALSKSRARMSAIRNGSAVQLVLLHENSQSPAVLLFLPDGQVIGTESVDSGGFGK